MRVDVRGDVGGVHDAGQFDQSCVGAELVCVDEGFEGAPLAAVGLGAVTVGGPVGVERVRLVPFGHGEDLVGGHVDDLGVRVDEALDQPRAGDPVYLRPFTGYPLHVDTSALRSQNMM